MSVIYCSSAGSRKEFIYKVLEIFKERVEGSQSFLIKPNIVSYEPYPTTTHPEVLETLLSALSKNKKIIISDGPAPDAGRSAKIINKSILGDVCNKYGYSLTNIYSTQKKKIISARGFRFTIHNLPLEVDMVISLPVLKVHNQCGITGALKNQFGYLTRMERFLWHGGLKDINRGIAEINAAAPCHLFIVDGILTMLDAQERRHGGRISELGYIYAGSDPVALDSFGLSLLAKVDDSFKDKNPEDILHLRYAEEYNLGEFKFEVKEI